MCVYQVPGPKREKRKLRLHAVKEGCGDQVATAPPRRLSSRLLERRQCRPYLRETHICACLRLPSARERLPILTRTDRADEAPFWRADLVRRVRGQTHMLLARTLTSQLARSCTVLISQQRAASLASQRSASLRRGPVVSWHGLAPALSSWTLLSRPLCTGRSAADHLSDTLQDANLLLADLVEDDDRSSEDFKNDLEELRAAYARVQEAYETALAVEAEALPGAGPPVGVKKSFELAVVGLRDKMTSLEAEAA